MKFNETKQYIRKKIWSELKKVALPDSRFHYDFSNFIPDFEGSYKCVEKIRSMEVYRQAKLLFITPDNCLEKLREWSIRDGKTYIMATYGIARGFILMKPEYVREEDLEFSSTLDGAERFSRRIGLREMAELGKIDLLVTGCSAVNLRGVRMGKGHGFFDIEWGIFSELGMVDDRTPIICVCHECQVVDVDIPASQWDTIVDYIVTPSRVISVNGPPKPKGIAWHLINPNLIDEIPVLRELKELKAVRSN